MNMTSPRHPETSRAVNSPSPFPTPWYRNKPQTRASHRPPPPPYRPKRTPRVFPSTSVVSLQQLTDIPIPVRKSPSTDQPDQPQARLPQNSRHHAVNTDTYLTHGPGDASDPRSRSTEAKWQQQVGSPLPDVTSPAFVPGKDKPRLMIGGLWTRPKESVEFTLGRPAAHYCCKPRRSGFYCRQAFSSR